MAEPKIAIVHDFLAEYGGAERVVEALHDLFPAAPIYTGFIDLRAFGPAKSAFAAMDLRPTFLQRLPFCSRLRSPYRIFAPAAFARLDLSAYDVIISSTNAYHAKAVRPRPGALHLCYCHTPARSLYGLDARANWRAHPLSHFFGRLANHFLRLTDFETAQQPTQILVNSHVVRERVRHFWRRDSLVVYPPVKLADAVPCTRLSVPRTSLSVPRTSKRVQSHPRPSASAPFLFVGRLNYAKHPELALQACLQLNLPLQIVGAGPLLQELKQLAAAHPHGHQITFLGQVSDTALAALYSRARALIFPAIDEDFGIVPVEAMAFGVPVIAHQSGGPTETIIAGRTGIFFADLTLSSLQHALQEFSRAKFDPQFIQKHAQQFSQKNFQQKILKLIHEKN